MPLAFPKLIINFGFIVALTLVSLSSAVVNLNPSFSWDRRPQLISFTFSGSLESTSTSLALLERTRNGRLACSPSVPGTAFISDCSPNALDVVNALNTSGHEVAVAGNNLTATLACLRLSSVSIKGARSANDINAIAHQLEYNSMAGPRSFPWSTSQLTQVPFTVDTDLLASFATNYNGPRLPFVISLNDVTTMLGPVATQIAINRIMSYQDVVAVTMLQIARTANATSAAEAESIAGVCRHPSSTTASISHIPTDATSSLPIATMTPAPTTSTQTTVLTTSPTPAPTSTIVVPSATTSDTPLPPMTTIAPTTSVTTAASTITVTPTSPTTVSSTTAASSTVAPTTTVTPTSPTTVSPTTSASSTVAPTTTVTPTSPTTVSPTTAASSTVAPTMTLTPSTTTTVAPTTPRVTTTAPTITVTPTAPTTVSPTTAASSTVAPTITVTPTSPTTVSPTIAASTTVAPTITVTPSTRTTVAPTTPTAVVPNITVTPTTGPPTNDAFATSPPNTTTGTADPRSSTGNDGSSSTSYIPYVLGIGGGFCTMAVVIVYKVLKREDRFPPVVTGGYVFEAEDRDIYDLEADTGSVHPIASRAHSGDDDIGSYADSDLSFSHDTDSYDDIELDTGSTGR